MKETNWMENERVKKYTEGNTYSAEELDDGDIEWFNELLQIVAEEAVKGFKDIAIEAFED